MNIFPAALITLTLFSTVAFSQEKNTSHRYGLDWKKDDYKRLAPHPKTTIEPNYRGGYDVKEGGVTRGYVEPRPNGSYEYKPKPRNDWFKTTPQSRSR